MVIALGDQHSAQSVEGASPQRTHAALRNTQAHRKLRLGQAGFDGEQADQVSMRPRQSSNGLP